MIPLTPPRPVGSRRRPPAVRFALPALGRLSGVFVPPPAVPASAVVMAALRRLRCAGLAGGLRNPT